MQAADRTRGRGAWSSFRLHLFDSKMDVHYRRFLVQQGFEELLRILSYTMRHAIQETLVQRFHAETGTFHLSCGEYAVLPLDWTAILGLRIGWYSVSIKFVDFDIASELLGLCYPLT